MTETKLYECRTNLTWDEGPPTVTISIHRTLEGAKMAALSSMESDFKKSLNFMPDYCGFKLFAFNSEGVVCVTSISLKE